MFDYVISKTDTLLRRVCCRTNVSVSLFRSSFRTKNPITIVVLRSILSDNSSLFDFSRFLFRPSALPSDSLLRLLCFSYFKVALFSLLFPVFRFLCRRLHPCYLILHLAHETNQRKNKNNRKRVCNLLTSLRSFFLKTRNDEHQSVILFNDIFQTKEKSLNANYVIGVGYYSCTQFLANLLRYVDSRVIGLRLITRQESEIHGNGSESSRSRNSISANLAIRVHEF